MSGVSALLPLSTPYICTACRGITLSELGDPWWYFHSPDYSSLRESADTCTCCALILQELQKALSWTAPGNTQVLDGSIQISRAAGFQNSSAKWKLMRVRIGLLDVDQERPPLAENPNRTIGGMMMFGILTPGERTEKETICQIDIFSNPDSKAHQLGIPPLSNRLDSEKKLDLLHQWFSDRTLTCRKRRLAKPLSNLRLPTRLLDVSANAQDACLVETSSFIESDTVIPIEWAALSYRWSPNQLVTTKTSLPLLLERIEYATLSGLFQDAISMTRRLGIRYLWIDALCIVQDDVDDWQSEAKRMGDIYEGAISTFAVHSKTDQDDSGFLQSTLPSSPLVALGSFTSTENDEFFISKRSIFNNDVNGSPLSKRAWVLQERILSERTIHFTPGQIYWEDGLQTTGENNRSLSYQKPSLSSDWFRTMELYTTCSMTKEEDKLIAISGLASRLYTKMGIPYCAGLWGNTLGRGLLWKRASNGMHRPEVTRASSWSWASLDGPVVFPDGKRISQKNIEYSDMGGASSEDHQQSLNSLNRKFPPQDLHTRILGVGNYSSGSLRQKLSWLDGPGWLTLQTWVEPCRASSSCLKDYHSWSAYPDYTNNLPQQLTQHLRTREITFISPSVRTFSISSIAALDEDDGTDMTGITSLELLYAALDTPSIGNSSSGVLLRECSDHPGEYTRVGVACMNADVFDRTYRVITIR